MYIDAMEMFYCSLGADKTIGGDYTLAMYKIISFSMKLQKSS